MDVKKFKEVSAEKMAFTVDEWTEIEKTIRYQFKEYLENYFLGNLWKDYNDKFFISPRIEFDDMKIEFAKLRYQPNVLRINNIPRNILESSGWYVEKLNFEKNWAFKLKSIGFEIEFSKRKMTWLRFLGKFLMICK